MKRGIIFGMILAITGDGRTIMNLMERTMMVGAISAVINNFETILKSFCDFFKFIMSHNL